MLKRGLEAARDGRILEDARSAFITVVKNGGTKTFLKSQISEQLLKFLHELASQGYLENASESRQTVTYKVPERQGHPLVPSCRSADS